MLTEAAIGAAILKALKGVLKWAWGYVKKTLHSFWENKWILAVAGTCSGLFIYCYNMLNNWFAFPPILNMAILGIFALINLSWLVSYWKSVPEEKKEGSDGPNVSTGN